MVTFLVHLTLLSIYEINGAIFKSYINLLIYSHSLRNIGLYKAKVCITNIYEMY